MFHVGFLLLALAGAGQAQVPFFGYCDANIKPMQNFDPTQYLGKWYEQEKYFAIFQFGGKCVTATYTDAGAGIIGVSNKQLHVFTNAPTTIEGTARAAAGAAPLEARLEVVFPSVPLQIPAPYWVLDTDYTSYAVVYACNGFGFFHTKFVWLLTRSRSAPIDVMHNVHSILDKNNISRAFLIKTDQVNCPTNN